MLGQQKKHIVPGWSIVLAATLLLLVSVSLIVRTMGTELNVSLLDRGSRMQESANSLVRPSVATLRTAKPDFTGGFVPDLATDDRAIPVAVLRAAKPDFIGGFVPESAMGQRAISVATLRAAKPDFTSGFVPDLATDDWAIPVAVLREAKPDSTGGFVPESTMGGKVFATNVESVLDDQEPNP